MYLPTPASAHQTALLLLSFRPISKRQHFLVVVGSLSPHLETNAHSRDDAGVIGVSKRSEEPPLFRSTKARHTLCLVSWEAFVCGLPGDVAILANSTSRDVLENRVGAGVGLRRRHERTLSPVHDVFRGEVSHVHRVQRMRKQVPP